MLKTLNLGGNEKLTGNSFRFMNNFVFPQLTILFIDDTMIGDLGIKYLIRN